MADQADKRVRRVIRDSMDRLIAGKPLHSGRKLTVMSLGEEELTAEVTALTATIHQLERIIHVMALENHQFRSSDPDLRKVVRLRTGAGSWRHVCWLVGRVARLAQKWL